MQRFGIAVSAFVLAAIVMALNGAAVAHDEVGDRFRAKLNGFNEVVGPGSISTTGRGTLRAHLHQDAATISYTLSYSAMESTVTQAHIHFAQQHVGGGVIAFLCGGGDKPACPSPGGTVTGVIDAADIIGPESQGIEPGSFGEAVRAMRAGATYANVHSMRWPAGEIRGQIRKND